MRQNQNKNYSAYYRTQSLIKVYPTEFVIRSLLGAYPRLKTDRAELVGRRILDLGFGDGRNMPLLADLGAYVHGVEVTSEICTHVIKQMAKVRVTVEARVGRNSEIPYEERYFDHVLACNSCYYVDAGQQFSDNLREVARVMKSGGLFIHSLPMGSTFIMDGAKDLGDGHMEITRDPYGVRVGAVLRKFESVEEIERTLSPWFTDIRIGSCRDDYWGSAVHLWLVVCRRR
jgi:SAM-dependent methyltransferase